MISPSGYQLNLTQPAALAVHLKEAVLHTVLRRRPDLIALHAAVLSSTSGSILLAGPSGHGKTTLAALLNASGMSAIADDVALVSAEASQVGGLPFAFAAKPDSWDVLRAQFPTLDELPEFRRPDGRIVKYIQPVRVLEQTSSVSAVVFPHFSPSARLRIARVGKIDALLSLLKEAINSEKWLTATGFLTLSRLIEGAVVVEVEYGDAHAAAAWIGATLTQPNPCWA
jgi:hypothetical protein